MNDYMRIERAIAYLEANFGNQPEVAEVARHVGLSESQFHRVFKRWAGITPKRFLEYVTAAHARRRLADSASILETALDSGLSGSGRLHDLFINTEGVTPGEIRRRGRGLELRYGVQPSPFGECFLAITGRGVAALSFLADGGEAEEVQGLGEKWPEAKFTYDPKGTAGTMKHIIDGLQDTRSQRPRLMVRGTNFQIRVWEALLRIPPGHVVSYGQVAAAAGSPNAVRAVGSAIGANPVPLLIPCHRVIRSTGAFGQYSGGVWRKRALLAWEAAHYEQ